VNLWQTRVDCGDRYAALEKWWLIVICVAVTWVAVGIYLCAPNEFTQRLAVIKFDADTPRFLARRTLLEKICAVTNSGRRN